MFVYLSRKNHSYIAQTSEYQISYFLTPESERSLGQKLLYLKKMLQKYSIMKTLRTWVFSKWRRLKKNSIGCWNKRVGHLDTLSFWKGSSQMALIELLQIIHSQGRRSETHVAERPRSNLWETKQFEHWIWFRSKYETIYCPRSHLLRQRSHFAQRVYFTWRRYGI